MPRAQETFWNFERGTFAVFAVLLLMAAWVYLFFPPPSIKAELEARAPRSGLSESDVRSPGDDPIGSPGDLAGLKRDPFALPDLTRLSRHDVKPKQEPEQQVVVKPPVDPPVVPPANQTEKLPRKPAPQKQEDPAAVTENGEGEAEKPFPLVLSGILRLKDDSGKRRILVKRRDGDGQYFELEEDDEFVVDETESLKVMEITPTTVTFERADGSLYRINRDPLDAWKPKLRDEVDEPDGEEPALGGARAETAEPGNFEIFDLGPDADLKPQDKKPLRKHTQRGRTDKKVRQSDIDELLDKIKEKSPDLMDQLEGVY